MNVNIFFTNWRRREHLSKIIDDTKKQTFVPNIFVIDNASNDIQHRFEYKHGDITLLNKDNSKMCWERWLAALENNNEYICVMDDDITFSENDVIENCVKYMNDNKNVDAIGAYGVKYSNQFGYFGSEHTYCKHKSAF